MTTSLAVDVNVSITTPKWNNVDAVDRAVTVTKEQVTSVDLPESLKLTDTVKDSKVVRVVAEGNIVLYAGNQAKMTGDSYLIYPTTALGRLYKVATFDSNGGHLPALGIAAIYDDTEITINFATNAVLTLDGVSYTNTMTINVQKYEVVQIIHQSLNGAIIRSNKDVVVNSGHTFLHRSSTVSGSDSGDHVEEQLLPTEYWSTEYVVISSQYQDNLGDFVRLYTSQDDTVITVDNGTLFAVHISAASTHYDIQLRGAPMLLKGDKAFQVAQFGISSGNSYLGDPYLLMTSATSQYKEEYRFLTPSIGAWSSFDIYVVLIANVLAKGNVTLDDAEIPIAWGQVGQSEYYFIRVSISEGVHIVRTEASGGVLGGMIYGLAINEQYGTALGTYLPKDDNNYRVRL